MAGRNEVHIGLKKKPDARAPELPALLRGRQSDAGPAATTCTLSAQQERRGWHSVTAGTSSHQQKFVTPELAVWLLGGAKSIRCPLPEQQKMDLK